GHSLSLGSDQVEEGTCDLLWGHHPMGFEDLVLGVDAMLFLLASRHGLADHQAHTATADMTGGDAVHGDAMATNLHGYSPGEADNAGLGGGVVGEAGEGRLVGDARHRVDDTAPPVAPHVCDDSLGAQECALESHAEVGIPDLLGHVLDGTTGSR